MLSIKYHFRLSATASYHFSVELSSKQALSSVERRVWVTFQFGAFLSWEMIMWLPLECVWVERFRPSEFTFSYVPGALGTHCFITTQKSAGEDKKTSLIFFKAHFLVPFEDLKDTPPSKQHLPEWTTVPPPHTHPQFLITCLYEKLKWEGSTIFTLPKITQVIEDRTGI